MYHDIALIKLEEPIKFDETVKAIKLIKEKCKFRPDLSVQFVGWGAMNYDTESDKPSNYAKTLKLGVYKLKSHDTCQNAVNEISQKKGVNKFKLPSNMICTEPIFRDSTPCVVSFNHYLHLVLQLK